ncbi:MAG: type II toxin-antitoxin system VapC family toxin [Polyangiales bacterium]
MIALDTNVLVHAHRADSPWHKRALEQVATLGGSRWAIPWPCLHEFLAIVTHPKIFNPPTPLEDAMLTVEGWIGSPLVTLLGELDGYYDALASLLRTGRVVGPRVHDARVAALCLQHGVTELWTMDRDFSRFPQLRTRNPFV